jgi:hypothetical protein
LTFSPRKSFERFHRKLTANEIPGHFSLRMPCRALDVHGPQFQKLKHKALVHALAQASIAVKKKRCAVFTAFFMQDRHRDFGYRYRARPRWCFSFKNDDAARDKLEPNARQTRGVAIRSVSQ